MSNSDRHEDDQELRATKRDIFGGSPRKVFFKLVILSLIVGFVMRMMDITPGTIFGTLGSYVGRTFADLGSFMGDLGVWFGFGAAIVFPLYIFIRLWRRWLS
ncbi:hypothetical protein [Maritalea porphyrae]|uniref:hypothetical protein n=1 Tax=Maritalea porphyrae TaxID=880732 RepID=UPI0022AEF8D0|nr:hypothetical protein [Maritalea porphyrae]MCZ4271595.1 hypothetical protein [Maritalea porphyrae]